MTETELQTFLSVDGLKRGELKSWLVATIATSMATYLLHGLALVYAGQSPRTTGVLAAMLTGVSIVLSTLFVSRTMSDATRAKMYDFGPAGDTSLSALLPDRPALNVIRRLWHHCIFGCVIGVLLLLLYCFLLGQMDAGVSPSLWLAPLLVSLYAMTTAFAALWLNMLASDIGRVQKRFRAMA